MFNKWNVVNKNYEILVQNKLALFNLSKLTVTLSKWEEGGNLDS